ncbi:MAG: symmetrical bis(5'-nucleosyl)-tetraphosphatase [Gammaproteobacteria bacterium]
MPTYAIGDLQGCYDELMDLLQKIQFDPARDQLWFAGDLVNRGPKSLEVLHFIKSLPNPIVVLGNHDLHLLAIANGHPYQQHTLAPILAAADCDELIDWLRQQHLFYYDPQLDFALVHAGLPPQWTIHQASEHAAEVERTLRGKSYPQFLEQLYSNKPNLWHEDLKGWERLRFIANALTRIRFCDAAGYLDFNTKGEIGSQPAGYLPWFKVPGRASQDTRIIFGHWAALEGKTDMPTAFAIDTGCIWGRALTALQLESGQRFSVPARKRAT